MMRSIQGLVSPGKDIVGHMGAVRTMVVTTQIKRMDTKTKPTLKIEWVAVIKVVWVVADGRERQGLQDGCYMFMLT